LNWNMWNITLNHECRNCLFKHNCTMSVLLRPLKHVCLVVQINLKCLASNLEQVWYLKFPQILLLKIT
jgi:hypothetical protein